MRVACPGRHQPTRQAPWTAGLGGWDTVVRWELPVGFFLEGQASWPAAFEDLLFQPAWLARPWAANYWAGDGSIIICCS